MIIKLVKIAAFTICAAALSACSSAPRHVQAETPLVTQNTQSIQGELIPQPYWTTLNNPNAVRLEFNSAYQISLSPIYVSALNNHCRLLTITSSHSAIESKRLACAAYSTLEKATDQVSWYLAPSIQPAQSPSSDNEFSFYKRISL